MPFLGTLAGTGDRVLRGNPRTLVGATDKTFASYDVNYIRANEQVTSAVVLADDSIVALGYFTRFGQSQAYFFVKLTSTGAVDASFMANVGSGPDNLVSCALQQPDGKIVLGGYFSTWNNTAVGKVIRLNSDGTRDTAFTPSVASSVKFLGRQSTGDLLIFTADASSVVRVNSAGTLDTTFASNRGSGANQVPTSACVGPSDQIYLSGPFSSFSGVSVGGLVRLNANGTLDTTYNNAVGTGVTSGLANSLQSLPDGRLIMVGVSGWQGTALWSNILRLNSDGTRDTAFTTAQAGANNYLGVTLLGNGQMYAVADGDALAGSTLSNIVRLNSDGTRDTAFTGTTIGVSTSRRYETIMSIINPGMGCVTQSTGKVILYGMYRSREGFATGYFVRLTSTGQIDPVGDLGPVTGTGAGHRVNALAQESGGSVLAAGAFRSWNGSSTPGIVRLSSSGVVDATFNTNIGTGPNLPILSVLPLSTGKILVTGMFTSWNGSSGASGSEFAIRLNANGTRDTFLSSTRYFFNDTYASVLCAAEDPSTNIILGGKFTNYYNGSGFVSAAGVLRLSSTGVLDTAFSTAVGAGPGTGSNNRVIDLVRQPDGKIVAVGIFATWNNTAVGNIVRLNSDGTRDTAFTTALGSGPSSYVTSVAWQSDGKLLICGEFTSVSGVSSGRVARLNSDGSVDSAFSAAVGAGASGIRSIEVLSTGKIMLGGEFTSFSGYPISRAVRLNSDGSVDQTFNINMLYAREQTSSGGSSAFLETSSGLIIGGDFYAVNDRPRSCIVRLLNDANGA